MAGDWERVRLGDLVRIAHGWPFKSELYSEELTGRPIVVSIGNFNYAGGFRFDSTTVKEYRGDYPPEFNLKPGEILLVMTCQTAGGEILGIPARVPNDGRQYLHNQRLGKVVINDDRADPNYLYYLFLSPQFNRELVSTASGTKILHTAPSRIEAFDFILPSSEEQKRIGQLLRAIDDKIDLNRKMNETLEGIARALFKSWFVDFDPVRAKAEGRDPSLPEQIAGLFPDSFEDSELGEIPRGWTIAPLGEHFDAVKGLSYKGSGLAKNGLPMHNLNSIYEGGGYKYEGIKYYTGEYRERHLIAPGDLIVANTEQGHDKLLIGYAAIVPESMAQSGIFTHHLYRMRPRIGTRFTSRYLAYLLNTSEMHDTVAGYTNGTTVNGLSADGLQFPLIVCPPEPLIRAFDKLASLVASCCELAINENCTLIQTRDSFLPKLISGEIRVAATEQSFCGGSV